MSSFEYQELPTPTSVRLVNLHLDENENFSTTMMVVEHDSVSYDTISYRWGDPADTIDLLCSGKNLAITRSLYDALWHIEKHLSVGALWVDQISINQQNIQERSKEVQRMGQIFAGARRTVAWLGALDKDSKVALDAIPKLAKHAISPIDRILGSGEEANSLKPRYFPLRDPTEWDCVGKFFTRPWFKRMWIIQEVCLSENIQFLCGEEHLDWDEFFSAVDTFKHQDLDRPGVDPAFNLSRRSPLDAGSSLSCLLDCNQFDVTDPRDKVFALLGLLPNLELIPDYSKTVEEVFIDTAKAITQRYLDNAAVASPLQLLWASVPNTDVNGQRRTLPSWVPDWRDQFSDSNQDFSYMRANHGLMSTSKPVVMDGQCLKVYGFRLDSICDLEDAIPQSYQSLPGAGLQRGIRFFQKYSKSIAVEFQDDLLTSLAHTITAGRFLLIRNRVSNFHSLFTEIFDSLAVAGSPAPEAHEWRSLDIFQKSMNRQVSASTSGGLSSQIQPQFIESERTATAHRRFCVTKNGLRALVPQTAQVGDEIVILRGSNFPVALRPSSSHSAMLRLFKRGKWENKGLCYAHGFSMGEMGDYWTEHMPRFEEFYIR